MMDMRWTYHGDHFKIYIDKELLCCTQKANIKVKVNYDQLIKTRKGWKDNMHSLLLRKIQH